AVRAAAGGAVRQARRQLVRGARGHRLHVQFRRRELADQPGRRIPVAGREEHRDPERVHRREELLRALSSGPGSEAVPAAPTAGTASAPWVRRPGRPGPSTRYAVVTGPADTARRARTGPAAATVTAQRRAA